MQQKHYDEQEIKSLIKQFRERMRGYPTVKIYFDADNTLYKFSTYNRIEESLALCMTKGFYKNLPIFPEAPIVIENLQHMGVDVYVLTGSVDSPWCRQEKMESLKYYFPMIPTQNIIITPEGAQKTQYVDDVQHSILVDDYHVNINQWFAEGGLAIKKSYSGKQRVVPVVCSLIDIFSVLYDLEIFGRN